MPILRALNSASEATHPASIVFAGGGGAIRSTASYLWTLAIGHHKDRTPTHGYEPTREAAMAAFAKSWRRE